MSAALGPIAAQLSRVRAYIRTELEARRLRSRNVQSSTRLGDALARARRNDFTPEETAWMSRIEALRQRINASTEAVTIPDFGAGDSTQTLSSDEMHKGRLKSRTVGEISRNASKPVFWCRVLFSLIREFKPERCVELGCCCGVSASYQSAALTLNGAGKFVTLEGSPDLVELSRKHFAELGLKNVSVVPGRFDQTLPGVLRENTPLDYAFIDGHHDHDATLAYFEDIYAVSAAETCIVFDDVNWSDGMKKAWHTVKQDSRVVETADLGTIGIALIRRAR